VPRSDQIAKFALCIPATQHHRRMTHTDASIALQRPQTKW